MSAPTDIRKYTESWLNLFDRFQDNPEEEYIIYCSSMKEAMKIRLEWYKARAAMQRSEAGLSVEGMSKMGHPNLNRKEAVIKGTNLHFIYKEAMPVAQLLEESMKRHDEEKENKNE